MFTGVSFGIGRKFAFEWHYLQNDNDEYGSMTVELLMSVIWILGQVHVGARDCRSGYHDFGFRR